MSQLKLLHFNLSSKKKKTFLISFHILRIWKISTFPFHCIVFHFSPYSPPSPPTTENFLLTLKQTENGPRYKRFSLLHFSDIYEGKTKSTQNSLALSAFESHIFLSVYTEKHVVTALSKPQQRLLRMCLALRSLRAFLHYFFIIHSSAEGTRRKIFR